MLAVVLSCLQLCWLMRRALQQQSRTRTRYAHAHAVTHTRMHMHTPSHAYARRSTPRRPALLDAVLLEQLPRRREAGKSCSSVCALFKPCVLCCSRAFALSRGCTFLVVMCASVLGCCTREIDLCDWLSFSQDALELFLGKYVPAAQDSSPYRASRRQLLSHRLCDLWEAAKEESPFPETVHDFLGMLLRLWLVLLALLLVSFSCSSKKTMRMRERLTNQPRLQKHASRGIHLAPTIEIAGGLPQDASKTAWSPPDASKTA